jgi:hypothetical protein
MGIQINKQTTIHPCLSSHSLDLTLLFLEASQPKVLTIHSSLCLSPLHQLFISLCTLSSMLVYLWLPFPPSLARRLSFFILSSCSPCLTPFPLIIAVLLLSFPHVPLLYLAVSTSCVVVSSLAVNVMLYCVTVCIYTNMYFSINGVFTLNPTCRVPGKSLDTPTHYFLGIFYIVE